MKNSNITVTDQFCGAGGSSQGVRMVAKERKLGSGLEVKLAMNHWKLAIETHNTNFPETDHVCTDISACDPRRYYSTNILITSPECTVHSPAGGGQAKKKKFGNQLHISGKLASDVAEERSRATMWDVCRFAEYHRYEIIIAENVIEARKWVLFDTWLRAMIALGYDYEIKYINSMHTHPTPQSRDRMYCVFWKKGNKKPDLNFTPIAPCNKCLKNVDAYQWWKPKKKSLIEGNYGKYKWQYLYKCPECNEIVEPYFYAAFNCIDWTKPGTRIGDRKRRLSPNTLDRCEYGVDKFWDQPTIINVRNGYGQSINSRVKSISHHPLHAQTSDIKVGLLSPVIISSRYIQGIGNRVKDSHDALPVQVTDGRESVLFPPLITNSEYGDTDKIKPATEASFTQTTQASSGILNSPLILDAGWSNGKPRVDVADRDPLSVTGQTKGLLMPLIVENYGQSKSRPSTERLGTIATKPKHGIITDESYNSFLTHYYGGSNVASHIVDPTKTISTKDRSALITPPEVPYTKPRVEDCYYRMLLPHEIQLGMAFDADYIVLGDSKQKVKQLGNAVTPPVMKLLIERCIETLL